MVLYIGGDKEINVKAKRSKKKQADEIYTITFLGLLSTSKHLDLQAAEEVLSTIELHLRRHNYNAIVLDGTDFVFTEVQKGEPNET